jgi:uncharacterized hydrophobic protein (TIGR00271 family)
VANLRRSSRLTGEFALLTVLASAIATLGLITDSAAVIIGAMLIAPLLSPIMALALSALGGRPHLVLRASITLGTGVVLSLGVALTLSWLALRLPFDVLATIPLEVTSRTHPGPFDLAIALAGGAAAAYALVRMRGAAALFGVAIATALVPPLCVVGIGLALGDAGIWMSAGILFATNAVAIPAAAAVVFTVLHLRPRRSRAGHSGLVLAGGLVVALGIVLVPSAISLAQQSQAAARTSQFADTVSLTVADVLATRLPGSRLVDVQRTVAGSVLELRVTAEVAEAPSTAQVAVIQADVATRLKRTVHLVVVGLPVVEIDSVSTAAPSALPEPSLTPTATPSPTPEPTPTPTPAPTMHPPGPVDSAAWFTPFVPRAVAAVDAGHVVLVGGTADGAAGVAATSGDGGHRWHVERLEAFPLASVSTAGTSVWAVTPCPAATGRACRPGLLTSADSGTTWAMAGVPGLAAPALVDALHGWAVSAPSSTGAATLFTTGDGGLTWAQGPVACPAEAPTVAGLAVTSATGGWLACAGGSTDPAAKALLITTDGGVTWTVWAVAGGVAGPATAATLPADGVLRGISMRPKGLGWLWTDAVLYRTTDSGAHWTATTLPGGSSGAVIESASLIDGKAGVVLVHDAAAGAVTLLGTGDGGGSWAVLGSWPTGLAASGQVEPSPSPVPSAGAAASPIAGGSSSPAP